MNGRERVYNTIKGLPVDRQPIYGWVFANMTEQITERFGSVAAFEDHYEFDAAHLFTPPAPYNMALIEQLRAENGELTPDMLLDVDFFTDPTDAAAYAPLEEALAHHRARGRFCYVQTPGFFEAFNEIFGIEEHLLNLAMYPDELNELYRRQADWTVQFADACIDRGVDCVHISDDWGAQKDLLFSPKQWREIVFPHMKRVVDHVHARGCLASLHSDGCIAKITDGIAEIGFDMVHPWQESAGMSYDLYLEKYADKFAILGGICVQTVLGLLPRKELESEIRRVFATLRGKRWICCTTHFVQDHCTMDDLVFAFDLIRELSR
jgi:uroporphyrinogen decarboxylase